MMHCEKRAAEAEACSWRGDIPVDLNPGRGSDHCADARVNRLINSRGLAAFSGQRAIGMSRLRRPAPFAR